MARESTTAQWFPIAIASIGVCLGVWFAREQWVYSLALLSFVVITIWPLEATLGLYVFLLPFDSISRLGASSDGKTVGFYLGGIATLVLFGLGLLQERLHPPSRLSRYWIAFVGWGIMTVFWALDETAVLTRVPTALGLLALYVVAACYEISKQQLERISFFAVAGGLAASLFSINNFWTGISTVEARSSLILGTQQADPNIFAAALMIPLALAMAGVWSGKGIFEKGVMLATSAVISFAILLTMSRGAVLGLLAVVAVYAWRLKLARWLLVLGTALGSLLWVLPALFFSRFKEAFSTGGAGRLDIWVAGFSALKHFILQGAGLSNFEIAYQQYAGFAPTFRGYFRAAHNIYLEIAVELGIIGFAIFVFAVAAHVRQLRLLTSHRSRPLPIAVACEAMTAGMGVSALFVGLLWQKSFWMVLIFGSFAVHAMRGRNSSPASEGQDCSCSTL